MQKDKYIFRSKTILSFVCFVVGVLVSAGCVQAWAVERAVCNEALTATGPVVTVARFNRFRENVIAAFNNYYVSSIPAGRRVALAALQGHFEGLFSKQSLAGVDGLLWDIQFFGIPAGTVARLGEPLTPMVLMPVAPAGPGGRRPPNPNEGLRLRQVLVRAVRSGVVDRQWSLAMESPHRLETSLQWLWWAQGLGLDLNELGFSHAELWPTGRGAWYRTYWPSNDIEPSEVDRTSRRALVAPEAPPIEFVQGTLNGLGQVFRLAENRSDWSWGSNLSATPNAPYSDPRNFMALAGSVLSVHFGFEVGARELIAPTITGFQSGVAALNAHLPDARQMPLTVEGVVGRRSDGALLATDPARIVHALIDQNPRILLAQEGPLALHDLATHTPLLLLPPEVLRLLIRQYRLVVDVLDELTTTYNISSVVKIYVLNALAKRFDTASGNFGIDVGRLTELMPSTAASFDRWPLDRMVHFGFERLVFGGDAPRDVITEWLKNVLQEPEITYRLPSVLRASNIRSGPSLEAILEGIVNARAHHDDSLGLPWSSERFIGALQSRIQELERAAQTATTARAERR